MPATARGYKGRVGLFELMIINDDMRDMIMRNASTDELRTAAMAPTAWSRCAKPAWTPCTKAPPRPKKSFVKPLWKRETGQSAISNQRSAVSMS